MASRMKRCSLDRTGPRLENDATRFTDNGLVGGKRHRSRLDLLYIFGLFLMICAYLKPSEAAVPSLDLRDFDVSVLDCSETSGSGSGDSDSDDEDDFTTLHKEAKAIVCAKLLKGRLPPPTTKPPPVRVVVREGYLSSMDNPGIITALVLACVLVALLIVATVVAFHFRQTQRRAMVIHAHGAKRLRSSAELTSKA